MWKAGWSTTFSRKTAASRACNTRRLEIPGRKRLEIDHSQANHAILG
jgi:hypothetical protein